MNLYNAIFRRKSCRQLSLEPFTDDELKDVKEAIENLEPLYDNVKLDYRIVPKTKGMYNIKAPHYLIVSGQGLDGEEESAGFMYEQLTLWFDIHEIGSVWLGKSVDVNRNKKGKDIIVIAFGYSDVSVHRDIHEFKRKDINEITNDPNNLCVQAVHLAPSGMNLQPWYLEKDGEQILLYKHNLNPIMAKAYTKTLVDMGIGLSHYAQARKELNKPFNFTKTSIGKKKDGYELFGILL